MSRWICGGKPGVHDPRALLDKLLLRDIINVLRSRHLRWCGHVKRAPSSSCIKMASEMQISSIKKRGRQRKTWSKRIVWKMISRNVALTTLTLKTVFYGELQFDKAWCCQPHLMGQGQHHNQKSDMTMMIKPRNMSWFAIQLKHFITR